MGKKIEVDSGLESFEIFDKKTKKKLGEFEFNPSDIGILKRYEDVVNVLNTFMDDVSEERFKKETKKILEEKEKIVTEQINYLFGAEIAENFFSITSPFTPVGNGELFLFNVLNAIANVVESETGERVKRISAKVNKYSAKYHG